MGVRLTDEGVTSNITLLW